MKYFLQLLFVVFVIQGCNSQPGTKKDSTATAAPVKAQPVFKPEKRDSVMNNYSLYLSGMKLPDSSNVPAKIVKNAYFKKYSLEMDSNFKKIDANRLSLMREWAKTELKTEQANPTTLFYPFSGPDILHAMAFYPNATQYVMIAMERPGDIPDISKWDSAQSAYYLHSVFTSLQDIFEKSYFITHKMMNDLQKVKVNGVAPLLCVFLERSGHPVVAMRRNHLNDDGSITELAADSIPNHVNDFIEIYFRTEGTDTLRKLIYFRANLGNQLFEGLPALQNNQTLMNYLSNLPDFYMYAKSASYLMNYGTFSNIRNICLKKSKSVLQDDTGIGFSYFDKNVWNMKLYGHYVTPVKDFRGVYDANLAAAYQKDSTKVQPLKFSLGYHWGNKNNQNLMKAERK